MTTPVDHGDAVFEALADPTRRRLIHDLAEWSPRTATQLSTAYPISRQGVLKHLHVLRDAGLVTTQRSGREARYSLAPEPMDDAIRWMREVGAIWDARLGRLKTFVEAQESG